MPNESAIQQYKRYSFNSLWFNRIIFDTGIIEFNYDDSRFG